MMVVIIIDYLEILIIQNFIFLFFILFYISFRYAVQRLDIYIVYKAIPPITFVPIWHYA